MSVDKVKKKRERSPPYPSVRLETCIEFAKKIDKLGGRTGASEDSLLGELNLKSPSTGSYIRKYSSSQQFGLIVRKDRILKLTNLGYSILCPKPDEDIEKLKLEAFKNPPIYQKLIEKYNREELPSVEGLKNVLMRDFNISKVGVRRAAPTFISSGKLVGVIGEDNILRVDLEETEKEEEEGVEGPVVPSETFEMHNLEIVLSSGKKAKLSIPSNISKNDKERLKRILDTLTSE